MTLRPMARRVIAAIFENATCGATAVGGNATGFGGNIALEYARGAFPRLRAAVSFHGTFGSAPASPIVVAPIAPPCSSITPTTISRTWT